MIPLWLPYYSVELNQTTEDLLSTISASTIDRILRVHRKRYSKIGLATTKPGSLIRKKIPIKTKQWDETFPGFIEADIRQLTDTLWKYCFGYVCIYTKYS